MSQVLESVDPSMSTAPRLRAYWENKTFQYNCLHDRLALVLSELCRIQPRCVLDVGCSTAALATALDTALPATAYYGCDISQAVVNAIGRSEVVRCDLNDGPLPFPDTRFDAVVASGICEYIVELPKLFAGIVKRLADDGHLIVSYANHRHVSRRWRRLTGRSDRGNATWQPLVDLNAFVAILKRSGLSSVRRWATTGHIHSTARPPRLAWPRRWRASWPLVDWAAPQVVFVCTKDR